MKNGTLAAFAAGLALTRLLGAEDAKPPYRDAHLAVETRVADLLSRMTLEEKVAQLQTVWNSVTPRALSSLPHGIGEVSRPSEVKGTPTGPTSRGPRDEVEFINAIQKHMVEETRLGIPAMFHEEAVHGLVAPKGTQFPVPIGLASTWDPALLQRVMSVAAQEARARGVQHVLAPVLDLARDPRWGRTEETYGEDPYLVSRLGVGAIRGYQGTSLPLAADKVYATAKHFAVHGPHEGGINTAPGNFSERIVREQYLLPFQAAVTEAKVYTVMPSYNELDGIPSHKNKWLLEQVLRGEWGFEGLVTSDYFAIAELQSRHAVAATLADAARQSLGAGVDMDLPDGVSFETLIAQVREGRVSEAMVDRSVGRVLRAKFLAGLFEAPYADADRAEQVTGTAEHRALALEAARKTIILLKNDKGLLPLDRSRIHSLAVIGPNAKGLHLGGYSATPGHSVDILSGIQAQAGAGIKVLYAEGCRITEAEPIWAQDQVVLADPAKNRQRIADAVGVAKQADVAVLVIGTNEATSREAWADNHLGDVASLDLMSQQDDLVQAVLATGKPTVVLLLNGRPQAIPRIAATVPAILEGWYLGQEGGTAAAEVLFGEVNPGGKLPISFPRSVGQLPVYYDRKPTSFRPYLDMPREPLYPFGFGLSYTTFKIENVKAEPAVIGPSGSTRVTADLSNTGKRPGDEVVQLYIRDRVSSVTRPVKELKGFERVTLAPGERKTVTFTLGPDALSLLDDHMNRVVEPGFFDLMVGTSSADIAATVPLEVR